jgi:hypothetical protein
MTADPILLGTPVPAGKCPDCTTADLTYGRTICQACSAVQLMKARAQREAGR